MSRCGGTRRQPGAVAPAGPARRPPGRALAALTLLGATLAGSPALSAEPSGVRACPESVPDLFDRVSPTVVYVAATSISPYRLSDRVTRVVGSGFIVASSGLILTNSHVAFGRQSIRVSLDSGETIPAELVGADPIFDVAVLRITPPVGAPLPVMVLGDSDQLRVGEEVLAIGNPLGLDQTLTRGIVSALNRILPETPLSLEEPLIQTDTAINPGSSGGPLLNLCGEVVGINTAIIPGAQNIGFAIPINLAKAALPQLLAKGKIVRPWVGFHGQLVTDTLRSLLRTPLVEGLLVEGVDPGSPAERAGIRGGQLDLVVAGHDFLVGGDVVTVLNGRKLTSQERLDEAMRALAVDQTLRLTIFRDGAYRNVEYVLPERPILPGDIPDDSSLDSSLDPSPAARPGPAPGPRRGARPGSR